MEPMKGFEPPTPSLPWKCSTPELHWQIEEWITYKIPKSTGLIQDHTVNCFIKSGEDGRRDSNPRPSAWKADALPTELLPLITPNSLAKVAHHLLQMSNTFPPELLAPQLSVGVIGFEPIQTESPDLQSGPALQLRRTPVKLVLAFRT
jgi:hypothetical protein